jgi:hypothetical protein
MCWSLWLSRLSCERSRVEIVLLQSGGPSFRSAFCAAMSCDKERPTFAPAYRPCLTVGIGGFAMPRVNMDEVIFALSNETKRALHDAMQEVMPNATYDVDELFQAFHRAIYRRCSKWQTVPDKAVEV